MNRAVIVKSDISTATLEALFDGDSYGRINEM